MLLLWALHALAPCLVAACLIIHHCIGARYVALSPAASPLLKTSAVWMLITSLLFILLPLLRIFSPMPSIAVSVPLVVPAIDLGGPKVACLYYCYGDAPLFVALACALGVVVESAWRLLLALLGPRTPFETAVHSPQPVVLHVVLLPPRCPLFLAL